MLGDKVEKVIVSRRLVDALCVLTKSEYGWFANVERIMEARALRDNPMTSHMVSKRTMEVNTTHFITKEFKKRRRDKSDRTVSSLLAHPDARVTFFVTSGFVWWTVP